MCKSIDTPPLLSFCLLFQLNASVSSVCCLCLQHGVAESVADRIDRFPRFTEATSVCAESLVVRKILLTEDRIDGHPRDACREGEERRYSGDRCTVVAQGLDGLGSVGTGGDGGEQEQDILLLDPGQQAVPEDQLSLGGEPVVMAENRSRTFFSLIQGSRLSRKISCPSEEYSGGMT